MRTLLVTCGVLVLAAAVSSGQGGASPDSLYALKATALNGSAVDLKTFEGKVTLVVNTASQCGFTPQYKGLQALHTELAPKGFSVLGFPSNDFAQESGSAEEIKTFCEKNYGVTFPMFSKVVTKAGPEQSPVYAFLGKSGNLPKWNFNKFLVDKHGKVVGYFPSNVTPESPELRQAIDKALATS